MNESPHFTDAQRESLIAGAAVIARECQMRGRSAVVAMKDMQYAGFDLLTSAEALRRVWH